MLKRILIANRGEIAVRIIRACRELGIETVSIYSEADKDALHVKLADKAICVGPAKPGKSYLNRNHIIEAACLSGCDSIHPGFGFLSESSNFAKMCTEIGLKWIGPSPELISLMGDKAKAKEMMQKAGVPVVLGSNGVLESEEQAEKLAEKIGYPIILKAANGGGGKGIRIAYTKEELKRAYLIVKQEAKNSFNDDKIYLEKFIENPRHIEVQILADEYGNAVSLGERDCSLQRHHQKVIEETPSSIITDKLRQKMGKITVNAMQEIGYTNAGTIEFLVDKDKNYYFMEMNTRLQVEHPVTEAVTGIDIVKEQIKIASKEKLLFSQKDITINGHSMECRINSENPAKNFMPCPGKITGLHLPGGNGIRVDTAIYEGYTVSSHYDSMIAKLIVHGKDREESIAKMKSAIAELVIEGVDTNIDFLYQILNHKKFQTNDYDTSFIEKELL
ncbi:MAG: acetyl-CoA carboxylase biotin carboxylase subunit [Clostridia bacterium]|jgi:acetyl-CoA carboxylase biotin carboxylase subunit|nr:acetyl-CoA carboxylase biotin carboxylase subunit [Clostridia bacterium]